MNDSHGCARTRLLAVGLVAATALAVSACSAPSTACSRDTDCKGAAEIRRGRMVVAMMPMSTSRMPVAVRMAVRMAVMIVSRHAISPLCSAA